MLDMIDYDLLITSPRFSYIPLFIPTLIRELGHLNLWSFVYRYHTSVYWRSANMAVMLKK